MNREQILREFEKIKLGFKRVEESFKLVDSHVGEHLRKILELGKTADELYLNAMTRDRMWTALMEMLVAKGVFSKAEFDAELDLLNKAIEKAVQDKIEKKAEESVPPVVPDPVPAAPEAAPIA